MKIKWIWSHKSANLSGNKEKYILFKTFWKKKTSSTQWHHEATLLADMEPMTMKIHRSNQSSQSYHNNISQWNGWNQQRLPSQYGQHNHAYNSAKTFTNRNAMKTERNLIKTERIALNTEHCSFQKCKQIDTNDRTVYNSQKSEALIIEWDCIDSFHEFAIYMDKSNPICPAEHLDTPEKLMNLLVF